MPEGSEAERAFLAAYAACDIKVYPRGKVCTSSKDKKSMKNVHFGIKLHPEENAFPTCRQT